MTLTDVISQRIVYGKGAIVTDNSSSDGISVTKNGGGDGIVVTQNGSGDGISVTQNGSGTAASFEGRNATQGKLSIFAQDKDISYDGGSDGVFVFSDTGGKTAFMGGLVGINTQNPSHRLDVNGNIGASSIIVNNAIGDGKIEVSGIGDAYIDVKVPESDDYDIRFGTSGTGGYISTLNSNLTIRASSSGRLILENLPIYANDAAAIAAGLTSEMVYKTATGELRIVV